MNRSLFKKETLKSIRGLMHIYANPETVQILDYIPTPMQLLEMQAGGNRCVSLLRSPKWFQHQFQHRRNLRDFVIHDLEHIWQMFENEKLAQAQIRFSQILLAQTKKQQFDSLLKKEPFKSEFEYIISDMNTHPAHTYATLKSLVIRQKQNEEKAESMTLDIQQEIEVNAVMQPFDELLHSC